jgi:hypothetical protein
MVDKNKYAVAKGRVGEHLAQHWFRLHKWVMQRTQPETRFISKGGKPIVIHCAGGGVADYTGYRMENFEGFVLPIYTAVEVKCHHGGEMRASVLRRDQREWMGNLPPNSAFVFILWDSGDMEMFKFRGSGLYRKGSFEV